MEKDKGKVIRIAVVGDQGVGKTSLISAAATDSFDSHPPPVLPVTQLPSELSAEQATILVTDTSSKPEHVQHMESAVQHSDVIVLCFDTQRRDTVMRVRTHWIRELQRLNPKGPIILVSCKSDGEDRRHMEETREKVEALVHEFAQIEVCLYCSAKQLKLVQDVFFLAGKSVIYPLNPLFDRVERSLKPLCVKALKRIFVMLDKDRDDALNDTELNEFQMVCFNTPLQPEELQNVKQIVQQKLPAGLNERGLTYSGFIFLHAMFIERGRLESTWAVMQKFGYNIQLTLSDELLDKVNFNVAPEHVMELSDAAVAFLKELFEQYDGDADGAITSGQINEMFSTAPVPLWQGNKALVLGAVGNLISRQAFIAKWRYSALKDPRNTLAQLLYLGFHGPPDGAPPAVLFTRQQRRKLDKRHDLSGRTTLHCYLFGAKGSGKSSLVKVLAGRRLEEPLGDRLEAVAPVSHQLLDRTLVVTEMAIKSSELAYAPSTSVSDDGTACDLNKCDIAAIVFDSSSAESFAEAERLILQVATLGGEHLPCVLIASKDDVGMSPELSSVVAASCSDLALPPPLHVSTVQGDLSGMWAAVVEAALHPEEHIPETPARKARKLLQRRLLIYSAAGLGTLLTGLLIWRLSSSRSSSGQQQQQPAAASSTSNGGTLHASSSLQHPASVAPGAGSDASSTAVSDFTNAASEASKAFGNMLWSAVGQQVAGKP